MYTLMRRKRLGIPVAFAAFLALVGVCTLALNATAANQSVAALGSLSGNGTWLAPNIIQYNDQDSHQVLLYESFKDAQGTDDTGFTSESIAQYLSHNKDTDLCYTDTNADTTYYADNASDLKHLKTLTTTPVMAAVHVAGISYKGDSTYPTLWVESVGFMQHLGGGCNDGGGTGTFNNTRPDGTLPIYKPSDPAAKNSPWILNNLIGTVQWLSPYTLSVKGTFTIPGYPDDGKAGSGDTWLDGTIENGREFYQSTNESGGSMSFTSKPAIPTNTPSDAVSSCNDFSTHIVIPYLDYVSPFAQPAGTPHYDYAQIYIPHLVNRNGQYCTDSPIAGWVQIANARPTTPPITSTDVTLGWTDVDKLQTTGAVTRADGSVIISDATTFTSTVPVANITGDDMKLTAPAECGGFQNTIDVNPYLLAPYATLTVYGYTQNNRCGQIENLTVKITTPYPNSSVDNSGDNGGPAGTNGSAAIPCPVNDALLGWVLCPVFNLAQTAVQTLNTLIQKVLFIDTSQIFGPGAGFQSSYNVIRNVGISLLVVAGLVMVVSQAAGLEAFSAYTIRKALPRIVIAAIGMSLAWPLMEFAITFFNDLGGWITNIILSVAPQASTGASSDQFATISGGIADLLIGGAIAFVAGVSIPIVFSLILSVAIVLFMGYAVLVVRQMIIILCIILAPLAIAASVLPGTEKGWKLWRSTFVGLLATFPAVMGMLAAGTAVAGIAETAAKNNGNNPGLELTAVVANFAGYALILPVMRMMSRALDGFTGMLNERGRGLLDGLRNGRIAARQRNRTAVRNEDRFSNNTRLGRWLNRRGARAYTGIGTGFGLIPGGAQRRAAALVDLRKGVAAAEAGREGLNMQLANDDDANAVMFLSAGRGGLRGGARAGQRLRDLHSTEVGGERYWEDGWNQQRVNSAVAQAQAVGINATNFRAAVQSLPANKARSLGTQREVTANILDPTTGAVLRSQTFTPEVVQTINETLNEGAYGNIAERQDLGETFGFNARKGGRTDISAFITGTDNLANLTPAQGWRRASMPELAANGTDALRVHGDDILNRFLRDPDPARRQEAAIQLLEMQNLLPHVSDDSKLAINEYLTRAGYVEEIPNALGPGRAGGRNHESAEDFLARQLAGPVTGGALRSEARVYDSRVPNQERNP